MRLAKTRISVLRWPLVLGGGIWGLSTGLMACSNSLLEGPPNQAAAIVDSSGTGTLVLTANGEDFVRTGLLSKDEWQVSFDHVYVTLDQAIAVQSGDTSTSVDTVSNSAEETSVRWDGPTTLDLASGEDPVIISEVSAPTGRYQQFSWTMSPATEGAAEGASILIEGQGTKQDQSFKFALKLDPRLTFRCGAYVGDERKGIVQPQKSAELEATFHFDHLFGDGTLPADDEINQEALGVEPLAQLAQSNVLTMDLETLETQLSPDDAAKLQKAILSLGHVGEGHCEAEL